MDRLRRGRRTAVLGLGWPPGSVGPEPGGQARLDEYGRGAFDPVTGVYEWYEIPDHLKPGKGTPVSWEQILTRWALVEADLHETYGIDLGERDLLRARSWRWLRVRILGLLAADTRIARAFAPEPSK